MNMSNLKRLTTLKESLENEIQFMKTFNRFSPKLGQAKELYNKVCSEIESIINPGAFNINVTPGKMTVNF